MTTLGHDSEFGLSLDGKIVSALDHLQEEVYEEGSLFPDNMNCEIAITPCTNPIEWHQKTEFLLDKIRDKGFELIMQPTILYPDECLENPLAYLSGCNPDFDAYTTLENKAPDFETMDGLRSCGAHVHFSTDLDPHLVCTWLDLTLAVPFLMKERASPRRDLYGKAGAMRVKEYGGEYRVLSNVWLESESDRQFVFEATHAALHLAETGAMPYPDEVRLAIDTHDRDLASYLVEQTEHMGVCHVG